MYITINYVTGSGVPFYVTASVQDGAGEFFAAGDIQSVTYTVLKRNGNEYVPETGFNQVAVNPADCFLAPAEDENLYSGYRNFRHIIPANENLFAEKNEKYEVDYRIYPTNGEVFGFTVYVKTV